MSKYRNAYRDELDNDDDNEPMFVQEDVEPELTPEEETFKKRYSDLRRHQHSTEANLRGEIAQLREQLNSAVSNGMKFPKSLDEVSVWKDKYPDAFGIIKTIVLSEIEEANTKVDQKLSRVSELEHRVNAKEALIELKKLHPDFDAINGNPEFHEWMKTQDQWMIDAIYHNDTNYRIAADVLDLYKARTRRKSTAPTARDVAGVVDRGESVSPSGRGRATFKESQVAKMSYREYDENEEAIDEAIRTGRFIYDISGAAR